MKDIDALEAILSHTQAAPEALEKLRRHRSLQAATPAERVHLEIAEDYDHLRAVVEQRFMAVEQMLELAELDNIDWHGI